MIHVVEAGTDAASLVIFDPLTLPADFDEQNRAGDPVTALSDLHDNGRIFYIEPGGDGAYLLHAVVDEPLPESLKDHVREPVYANEFEVSSGRVFFVGAEYAFHKDDAFLQKYPGMGNSWSMQPGTYRASLYRTEFPDGLADRRLEERLPESEYRLHRLINYLTIMAIVIVLVALFSGLLLPRSIWLLLLPVAAIMAVAVFWLRRTPEVRHARKVWLEVQREFPSLVAHFEKV